MKTVGLFDTDTRIYYVDIDFVVVNNPYNGGKPVIVMRHLGVPNPRRILQVLKEVNMELVGQPFVRDDGLWCHEVKEREGGNGQAKV